MLLTKANKEAAISMVEGDKSSFPESTKKRLLNSAVKLYGSGKNGGGFSGSGVIFNLDQNKVTILTAAHNVQIWATPDDPADDWDTYASGFAEAMTIGYGKDKDMTFNAAPTGNAPKNKNSASAPPTQEDCTDQEKCLYDLLVITSTDNGLRTYARNFVFGGKSFNDIATQVQQEAKMIINSAEVLLDATLYYYIQLGYGLITDTREKQKKAANGKIEVIQAITKSCQAEANMTAHNLHYRLTNPSFKEFNTYYNQSADAGQAPVYEMFPTVVSLKGKAASSTAKGDSGGPLYVVEEKNPANVYLLGVTTGADMESARQPCHYVFKNVITTSVKPYLKSLFPNL
jgi:hypothetical protein